MAFTSWNYKVKTPPIELLAIEKAGPVSASTACVLTLPVKARFYLPLNLSKPSMNAPFVYGFLIKLEARVVRYRRIEYVSNFNIC